MSRKTVSAILSGHAGISLETAVRLSLAFGATAESWLAQQIQYDLAQAERKRTNLKVSRLVTVTASSQMLT